MIELVLSYIEKFVEHFILSFLYWHNIHAVVSEKQVIKERVNLDNILSNFYLIWRSQLEYDTITALLALSAESLFQICCCDSILVF